MRFSTQKTPHREKKSEKIGASDGKGTAADGVQRAQNGVAPSLTSAIPPQFFPLDQISHIPTSLARQNGIEKNRSTKEGLRDVLKRREYEIIRAIIGARADFLSIREGDEA
mmetsp:Transcript_19251/g.38296  ORF Transcript_19251/g.38296 Transcript_19251/m.38296 type:complete len:111 (+) Transcript_19251:174-506(+)